MISFILNTFSWLPLPLFLLVSAMFTLFFIFVCVSLIKVLISLITFLKAILGGILGKVVQMFV